MMPEWAGAWRPVLFGACAGAMGWGIRGQYGHETGAMIAGLLVSLVLTLVLCPEASLPSAVRAVAFGTVAMGFGGSMTYGQTVGLTHDPALVGNAAAWSWGMLGLAIKGGLWIGFAGLFLGWGLGGGRIRWQEMLGLMLALVGLFALGIWLLNRPFDPEHRILPRLYFSADWRWQPEASLKPRPEVWGGMLLALLGAWVYAGWVRGDRLARALTLWGIVGGAVGFPLGQSLQSYHAWHPEVFRTGFWAQLDPHMNWWNWMETTFGCVMGASLGLGLWVHRGRIGLSAAGGTVKPGSDRPGGDGLLPVPVEFLLLGIHLVLLVACEFASLPAVDIFYDHGLVLGLIPMVAVAGGRWWPFLVLLPVTLVPIAGKTVRELAYQEQAIGVLPGWLVYGAIPLAAATWMAGAYARRTDSGVTFAVFGRPALLFATWLYLGLNAAFFRFPWPWAEWTARTPNAMVFAACAVILTVAALGPRSRQLRAG